MRNIKAMEECLRFNKCNSPICPLDSDVRFRNKLVGEEKCSVSKKTRLRIGMKYNLPNIGLKSRELSAMKNWENKSEGEKKRIKERLRKNRFGG